MCRISNQYGAPGHLTSCARLNFWRISSPSHEFRHLRSSRSTRILANTITTSKQSFPFGQEGFPKKLVCTLNCLMVYWKMDSSRLLDLFTFQTRRNFSKPNASSLGSCTTWEKRCPYWVILGKQECLAENIGFDTAENGPLKVWGIIGVSVYRE